MSHEVIKIACPACGKPTQLIHVTAGVTIVKPVGGRIENGVTTRGFQYVGGEWAGYQCAECRKILAVDGDAAYKLIEKLQIK